MNLTGETVRKVEGEVKDRRGTFILEIVAGGALLIVSFKLSENRTFMRAMDDQNGLMLVMMILSGILLLILGIIACFLYTPSRYSRNSMEIKEDGVIVTNINGEQWSAPYEEIKSVSVRKISTGCGVYVGSIYGTQALLYLKEESDGVELCRFIENLQQESKSKRGANT